MKLQSKTALREEIKDRAGNLGWLDNIWIDEYGNWSIHSTGTICPDEIKVSFGEIAEQCYGESLNSAITRGFKSVEKKLDKRFNKGEKDV